MVTIRANKDSGPEISDRHHLAFEIKILSSAYKEPWFNALDLKREGASAFTPVEPVEKVLYRRRRVDYAGMLKKAIGGVGLLRRTYSAGAAESSRPGVRDGNIRCARLARSIMGRFE